MRNYRWEGTATALTSIAHGGDTLGTITYLRREAFLTPTGRLDIPVLSGNGVRGTLRDIGATLLWEHLDRPTLPLPAVHALWSGGALVKTKAAPLTGQRLADLRRMIAHVSVFGVAAGGRIIDGRLVVGKSVPICTQTAHLLPEPLRDEAVHDIHDLTQIERYTRLRDADTHPHLVATNNEGDPHNDTGSDTGPDQGSDQGPDQGSDGSYEEGLMRYGSETFAAGTRFHTMFALRGATPAEYDFFHDTLTTYLAAPTIGGRLSRGHGHVRYDLTTPPPDDPDASWRTLGGATTDEATNALTWLT